MAIPRYHEMYKAFLDAIKDGKPHHLREIVEFVVRAMNISRRDREKIIKCGKLLFEDRLSWTKNHLGKAKLIDRIERGVYVVTQRGKKVLEDNPHVLDNEYLLRFEEFRNFRGVRCDSHAERDVFSDNIRDIEGAVKYSDKLLDDLIPLLEEHFPNGIRPGSVIDINKLKRRYPEVDGMDVPALLKAAGIRHGEKVFFISQDGKTRLAELLTDLIDDGNLLFYYEELYELHSDFLQEIHIFSSGLLRAVLLEMLPPLFYSKNSVLTKNGVTVESEVLRCYEVDVRLSYQQLKSKLPYVPIEKIKQVLAENSDFIWVETGVYTHESKIEIDANERYHAETWVKSEIAEHGYASLASVDVSTSLELNPYLSAIAVKNSLYQICLAKNYEKRGNIITTRGTALDSAAVFEDFCLTRDRLTLSELLEFEKETNGGAGSRLLLTAYDIMIRVDGEIFVSDDKISFDVEAVDKALALFVHADVIPLRTVTSFTSFPHIDGCRWNLFLLESYCRRFSKRFKHLCLSVNSRNVGAIFRKSAGFTDYVDVLVAVVVDAGVDLNEQAVGNFLFDRGYIARRTSAIPKIVAGAKMNRRKERLG